MRNSLHSCARLTAATLVAGFMLGAPAPASAETPKLAPGWQALLGCWEPVATARDAAPDSTRAHLVCVVPVAGGNAVDMVTVVDGRAVERERVDASGARVPLTRDDCSGWQSAEWSATGSRLYLRSELTCEGGLQRTSTGVISMPTPSEWVDVQSVTVGERKAVRALRYREARASVPRPAEVTEALGPRPFATSTARMAAAAPVSPADLLDVTRRLDAAAVEVWLVEQELAFVADAKQVVQFADAGVPASVIDMVVALSYPDRFSVSSAAPEERVSEPRSEVFDARRGSGYGVGRYDPFWDPYYGSRYDRRYYSPYGYSQYGYGYGYGSGWYPGYRPVIIVEGPSQPGTTPVARPRGRIVNGRGYTRGDSVASPDVDRSRPAPTTRDRTRDTDSSTGSARGSSGGSTGGSSGSTGSSGSSGSGERTAKRRPPPTS